MIELIVVVNSIGINLSECRGKRGAFVDSFYRAADGAMLPAEDSGVVKIGDRITYIAGSFVFDYTLLEVQELLQTCERPLLLQFRRYDKIEVSSLLLHDPRCLPWIELYCETVGHKFCTDSRRKIDVYLISALLVDICCSGIEIVREVQVIAVDVVMFCVISFDPIDVPEVLQRGVRELTASVDISADNLFKCVCASYALLYDDLSRSLLEPFSNSPHAAQMVAWMADAAQFYRATFTEIITDRILSACYYLFLCYTGRQRKMRLYLLDIQSPDNKTRVKLQNNTHSYDSHVQDIAAGAMRDGVLLSFYASSLYEAVLQELAVADRDRSVSAADCHCPSVCEGPWRSGSLQRILRSVSLAAGISLHKQAVDVTTPSAASSVQASFDLIHFKTTSSDKINNASSGIATEIMRAETCTRIGKIPSLYHKPEILPFLSPSPPPSITSTRCCPYSEEGAGRGGSVLLFSFIVPPMNGIVLYGASLIQYKECNSNDANSVRSECAGEIGESDQHPHILDTEPLDAAMLTEPHSTISTTSGSATGTLDSTPQPLPNKDNGEELFPLPRHSSSSSSSSDWFQSMFAQAQAGGSGDGSGDGKARRGNIPSNAARIFNEIKRWGDEHTPLLYSTPSTSTKDDSVELNQSEDFNAETNRDECNVQQQLHHQHYLQRNMTLSPILRAIGLRPFPSANNASIGTSRNHAAYNLESSANLPTSNWVAFSPRPESVPLISPQGQQQQQQVIESGLAILSRTPSIGVLADALRGVADFADSAVDGWDEILEGTLILNALDAVQDTTCNNRCRTMSAPASDFNPQAIYEALSPAALSVIIAAFLAESKILVVSTQKLSAALQLGEWLRQVISPLEWCHVYSPVLADQRMAEALVHCPAPYFLGILRGSLRGGVATTPPADVLIVDMDSGQLRIPTDLNPVISVARKLSARLSRLLKPAYHSLDTASTGNCPTSSPLQPPAVEIITVCRGFVQQLLRCTESCTLVLQRDNEEIVVVFDENRFRFKCMRALIPCEVFERDRESAEQFIQLFLRAQCCSQYVLGLHS